MDADVWERAGGQDGAADLRVGRLIGAHGIENDVDWHARNGELSDSGAETQSRPERRIREGLLLRDETGG